MNMKTSMSRDPTFVVARTLDGMFAVVGAGDTVAEFHCEAAAVTAAAALNSGPAQMLTPAGRWTDLAPCRELGPVENAA